MVVSENRVVLGLLRSKELDGKADLSIEEAMRPGPSTFRPFVSTVEMAAFMSEHDLENAPITTSDGRLVGLLGREDVAKVAHELRQKANAAKEPDDDK